MGAAVNPAHSLEIVLDARLSTLLQSVYRLPLSSPIHMSLPSTPTYASVRVDDSLYANISLAKLAGKAVVDLQGYISREFGDPTFKISKVIFADGTDSWVEGEHDHPYLGEIPGVDDEVLTAIAKEMDSAS